MANEWGDQPVAAPVASSPQGANEWGDKLASGGGSAQPSAASRLWSSFVAALPHPIDAIKEWADRPAEIRKAMDGLHELNQLEGHAAKDPQNQGKPRNQWIWPAATPDQRQTIEAGMNARLGTAEGNFAGEIAAPAVTAGKQAVSGDLAGAGGTLLGGYVAPAAAAAVGPAIVKGAPGAAKAVTRGAAAAAPDVAAGTAKVAGGATLGYIAGKLGLGQIAEYLSAAPMVRAGLKQAVQGIKTGWQAAKGAVTPAEEVAAPPIEPATTTTTAPTAQPPTLADLQAAARRVFQKRATAPAAAPQPPPEAPPAAAPRSISLPSTPGRGGQLGVTYYAGPQPPPEAPPAAAPAASSTPPTSPAAPAAAAPEGAIPVPERGLPPKLITEKQFGQWAAENGLAAEEAEAQLNGQNVRVIDRSTLNRTLHAIVGDHETLSGIAKSTYKVDSLSKLTDEHMLELVDRLSKEQAAPAPAGPGARGSSLQSAQGPGASAATPATAPAAPDLTGQLEQSLAAARARRTAAAQTLGPPAPEPGQVVTLKNGKTGTVTEVRPDGSFEYMHHHVR